MSNPKPQQNTDHIFKPDELLEIQTGKSTDATKISDQPDIDLQANLKRLAALSIIDYERCRRDEAKKLRIRPVALDTLVQAERSLRVDTAEKRSKKQLFTAVEPWGDPVDGAVLLDEIVLLVEKFIACEKSTTQAVALWIMFTWVIDAMEISPIACITAPEKRCGKTQLLNLIGLLCLKPLPASNISASALFRSIDAFEPTLLIDEADTFLSRDDEIRGIINSGHTRLSAFVIRTTGETYEPMKFSTWSAKAISGIGQLSDTLKDRSIIFELRRKQKHEKRIRLRHGNTHCFEVFRRKLARWAQDNIAALRGAEPLLPTMLNDRAQDNWEPLLIIADRVGNHWHHTARNAAISLSGTEQAAPSINEELLEDIQKTFHAKNTSRLLTAELLESLCSNEEAAWATWNQGAKMDSRQLSKRLRSFGISSKDLRTESGRGKGYMLSDFKDAFERYIRQELNPSNQISTVSG